MDSQAVEKLFCLISDLYEALPRMDLYQSGKHDRQLKAHFYFLGGTEVQYVDLLKAMAGMSLIEHQWHRNGHDVDLISRWGVYFRRAALELASLLDADVSVVSSQLALGGLYFPKEAPHG
jgi:hypothetical protein